MTRTECLEKAQYLSFTAAMNQRYHQEKASRWAKADQFIRIVVGVVSVVGLVLSTVGAQGGGDAINWSSVGASIVGLAVAIALNVIPTGDRVLFYRDLFRRWTDFREDIDGFCLELENCAEGAVDDERARQLCELTAKKNRVEGNEVGLDSKLLMKCWSDENASRTGYRTQEEKDAAMEKKSAQQDMVPSGA